MNGYGTLRRCTNKSKVIDEPYLNLAALTIHTPPHQPRPQPLPLANSAHNPPPPLTINCRTL